jgi:cytochrome c peroxidase
MHDGSIGTLDEVIDYYDRGGNANPWLDPELRPLRLSTEDPGRVLERPLRTLDGRRSLLVMSA